MFQKALLLGVVGVVAALPAQFYSHPEPVYIPAYGDQKYESGHPFQFQYSVNDGQQGSYYQHYANSDGKNVDGSYKVHLSDGRIQTVKYTADPVDGYIAQVTYEGEAQHPEVYGGPVVYQPVHAPQYSY